MNADGHTLILGGIRSGKSRLAERLARDSGLPVTYIATATPGDDAAMAARITAHRARRPAHWQTIEEPLRLAAALAEAATGRGCIVVDCLTLWLTNLLLADDPAQLEREREGLLRQLAVTPGPVILVSNETNLGIVPLGELSRRFCDEAGCLHQELARHCERVIWTVAGLPQVLKGRPV